MRRQPPTAARTNAALRRGQTSRSLAALLLCCLVAGCGAGSGGSSGLASSGNSVPDTTNSSAGASTADASTGDEATDAADDASPDDLDDSPNDKPNDKPNDSAMTTTGIEIDPSWEPLLEPRFVSQAPLGAIVSLYAEPSTTSDVVGSVRAGESGLTLFDLVEDIDDRLWSPVKTADGVVGWIKANLLRPEPSVSPPERIGDSPLRGSDTTRLAVAGLSAPEILADQIDERGLTMSATAFIDDNAVVLTADQLRTAPADDTQMITWGVEAGVDEPITATMTERFRTLSGSTAITSTEATGFDVQVGVGNIPSNITEAFPGAEWVELHFSGTAAFGGLDWESITFVFDTSTETPVLLAITAASWSP